MAFTHERSGASGRFAPRQPGVAGVRLLPSPAPFAPPIASSHDHSSRLFPRRVSIWLIFVIIGIAVGFLDRLLPWFR